MLALACGDPLAPAQRLDEPRVLGLRFSSNEGDATLTPGSGAEFEVLLAGPEGVLDARFGYALCEPTDSKRGVPSCARRPFAEGTQSLALAPVPFDVPAGLAEGQPVLLLGVACVKGEPRLGAEPLDWTCTGRGTSLGVSFTARTTSETQANTNPDLSALRVSLGDSDVAVEDASFAASCDQGVVEVARGSRHAFDFRLGGRARETADPVAGGGTETLQLSRSSSRCAASRWSARWRCRTRWRRRCVSRGASRWCRADSR
jgi:hypothetical protein